jgi:nucleoid-associated protein YgaU
MPKKKTTKKSIKTQPKPKKKVSKKEVKVQSGTDLFNSFASQVKLKESYASLFLGIVVVVVALVLGGILLRGKGYSSNPNLKETMSPSPSSQAQSRTYVVQEGEGLSDVAQKIYGNPDYWTKIAEANNIAYPDYVEPGTRLVIPDLK